MKIGRVLTGVVFAAAVFAANAEERFFVGCNYWASHAGMMMWRDWDGARVEGDLDRCRAAGMTMLRVFPLWPDFQPLTAEYGGGGAFRGWTQAGGPLRNDAAVDDVMMKRFRFLCDAAAKRGVRLAVGLVTGWMSGRLFVPPALEGRNVLVDADAVMWQTRFVRHFVREMKDHPAIYAWDLGNECNCMGGANAAQAWNWMNALASAIRLEDATRPIVSGMHGCPTASGAPWSLRMQGELVDVTTTHPYPLWTPDCNREEFNTLRDELHAAAEVAGLAPVVQKPETAPELVLSEHPDGKGGVYVVAVNASPKTITCKLKISGKVEYVWSGKMRGGELTLPPNDGCVVLIRSH